jgi:tartrate dehydrogenase/decarboxylase/D-malate dehydrogenase
MTLDVALLPGDGIGPEVVDATVPVLERLADAYGFGLRTTRYGWNSERYLERGEMLPPDGPDRLADYDAILHGAMGHPDVPDHISSGQGHLRIRRAFDHYINKRPTRLFDGVRCPLRDYGPGDIDIEWYRENSEGEYIDMGGLMDRGGTGELAIQSSIYTRRGIERIARAAFDAATEREGLVTNVTKSNALSYGPVLWDSVVEAVGEEYPDVTLEHLYVDAANMDLVRRPEAFDVVVSSNLFGDILTDLTAQITGGLGLAPSANRNPENDYPDMYEPIHGSAPDIAGQGVANPLATALSAGLMLEDAGHADAAGALRRAVEAQLADGEAPRTPDLGGDAGTDEVAADLRSRL